MTPKPVTWYLKIWYIEFATFFSRRTRIRVTKWDTYEKMIIYWKYRWGKTLISLALKFFAHKVICNYIPEQGTYFVCLNVALPNFVLVLLLPVHSDSCSHSPHSTHSVVGWRKSKFHSVYGNLIKYFTKTTYLIYPKTLPTIFILLVVSK